MAILAIGLLCSAGGAAHADGCPGSDQADDQACPTTPADRMAPPGDYTMPTVDVSGDPIPYVEETTAPADGTALTFDDPN